MTDEREKRFLAAIDSWFADGDLVKLRANLSREIADAESAGRFTVSGFGHVSHFLTCTNPSRFSKSKPDQAQEVIAKKLKFVRMAIDCAAAVGCIAESPSVPCDCPSCQVTAIAAELKLGGR
ncbi:MAG: hypothetical protein IT427_06475 [Pirellulales bacterium]|nr:hypothetical protein [Pirellulales bacterium]